jgi:hypothetical protein
VRVFQIFMSSLKRIGRFSRCAQKHIALHLMWVLTFCPIFLRRLDHINRLDHIDRLDRIDRLDLIDRSY